MTMYTVWDEINNEESEGVAIEALNAESAAVRYAQQDHDGWTDGLYYECAQPVAVKDACGKVLRFEVQAEMRPIFHATPAAPTSQDDGQEQGG